MGICEAIYNKETGAILTRTPASWGKIGLFYLVYYTCLACFFAGLLAIFLYAFTDDKAPLLTGEHSVKRHFSHKMAQTILSFRPTDAGTNEYKKSYISQRIRKLYYL